MTDSDSYEFRFSLTNASESEGHTMILASGRMNNFLCDPRHWARSFPGKLSARLVDLLRIAAAVYVSDRISVRDRRHVLSGWPRKLSMSVEVLDIDFWSRVEVLECLHRCLEFLSGDLWDIRFRKSLARFDLGHLEFPPDWKPVSEDAVICLYSGGLDSAAGLVRRITEKGNRTMIPLLVRHQNGQGKLVREQIDAIRFALGAHLQALVLPFWMMNPAHLGREEASQRTRSFMFCSAAGVAATMLEARGIEMMEGGIGAINVPLMAGMVGSKATRSSHPTFLRRFSALLQLVSERDLRVDLPHQYLTKAELVSSLSALGLHDMAVTTASCVHYPLRNSQAKQCGVCPACIFRRQALSIAGIDEPDGQYEYDLFNACGSNIPSGRLDYLRAFLMQVDKLSSLDHSDRLPSSLVQHLKATEVVVDGQISRKLIDLYRRYRQEWLLLVGRGLRKSWKWCDMIAPVSTE